jgi:hypothetical protein
MSRVECGRDSAALDPRDLRERVVEVCVVTQEKHEPLSLGERCNHGSRSSQSPGWPFASSS